jgi:hypothetical protein
MIFELEGDSAVLNESKKVEWWLKASTNRSKKKGWLLLTSHSTSIITLGLRE